ncbi:hypothetical protein AVEN_171629-1 [Araneus ventricosus]|uniref:Uncharacterized protein n=1 Tax=Araneus ventricosus TaxID=182803 RepID=A0A4Y2F0F4_ARAVE|nr:hypothetical protein AVEN_171629-1 [Araneus ventricosus]
MLKSRFEATRGLIWNGLRNFEPRSGNEDDAQLVPHLQGSAPHERDDVLAPAYDLACNGPAYTADLQWHLVSNLGALRSRGRGLATWPPCPFNEFESFVNS